MTSPEPGALAQGLWGRLRDILLVAARIDSFAFGEADATPAGIAAADADVLAEDFVVRALHAATDRLNWTILVAIAPADGVPLDGLAASSGLPRVVVSERVSDLVQAGLAARVLDADTVHATRAGEVLVAWISAEAADLAGLARTTPTRHEGGPSRGLPVL